MSYHKPSLAILPLRDLVVFPNIVVPLFVGRKSSLDALEHAAEHEEPILLVAQKDAQVEKPTKTKLYKEGTLARILQILQLPDGTVKLLIEGIERVTLGKTSSQRGFLSAQYQPIIELAPQSKALDKKIQRELILSLEEYAKINHKIPKELLPTVQGLSSLNRMADTIAAQLDLKCESKQKLLALACPVERAQALIQLLRDDIQAIETEKEMRSMVKKQVDKSQRDYYLNEQKKVIQKMLGEGEDELDNFNELEKNIHNAKMSKEAAQKALYELKKLKMMSPMSAESSICRNYIDWLVDLPWDKRSKTTSDLKLATKILDSDHFGLEKVKERIIEHLAVLKRVKKSKGAILCLVGPPGVGKTSLGRSIAKAMGREYIRVALGGVRDEAEIRGHRRTYVGAMPGKIIQKLAKVKVNNPLFLLDEIDKMAADFRGDPASALLEVLDPEQNAHFSDHFLEVDYDLSNVIFVATANSLDIPEALLDRLEIIRLPGYTQSEKLEIAQDYLVPKQIKAAGLKQSEIVLSKEVITQVIEDYTREAGVRSLEKQLAKICRKSLLAILGDVDAAPLQLDSKLVEEYLGVIKYRSQEISAKPTIGRVNGLAWTSVGGELLKIEAVQLKGSGKSKFTGKLGTVMQESIQAALTVVQARAQLFNLEDKVFETSDFHIHVPEGATPKDGPSAGIGMCTAIVSALTGIPVKNTVAMTGEITLMGEVLAIGGLKEKLLAAARAGVKEVLIPKENECELAEVPQEILAQITVHSVQSIEEVLDLALESSYSGVMMRKRASSKKQQPSQKH